VRGLPARGLQQMEKGKEIIPSSELATRASG
jgi:hypothetical protein